MSSAAAWENRDRRRLRKLRDRFRQTSDNAAQKEALRQIDRRWQQRRRP